jgi:hypothetical protein
MGLNVRVNQKRTGFHKLKYVYLSFLDNRILLFCQEWRTAPFVLRLFLRLVLRIEHLESLERANFMFGFICNI